MINSLTDFTKSAGLMVSCPPNTDANDIPGLGISTHPNFRASNKKKRQSWNYRSIRCGHDYKANDKRMLRQGFMYRRQLLLASTSLPALKPQQMMMAAMPPPPNLTDYHKLANVVHETQKFKNSPHGRPEINDAVCWPLKPPSSRSADDKLAGVVGVSTAEEELRRGINGNEVVTARVRRAAALKQRLQYKEEEVVLEGIEVTDEKPLCFDVYIRLGQDDDDDEEELYAGTFSHMPPRKKQRGRQKNKAVCDGREEGEKRVRRCCLRLGMSDMLIDRDEAESVTVKLVPTFKVEEDPIKVDSIFIDYT